jgi:hypothetical protein
MSCFEPTKLKLAVCSFCGPHAGLLTTDDRRYQECTECKRELVTNGRFIKYPKPNQIKVLPQKLVETFPEVVITQVLIRDVLYRDTKGEKYGKISDEWQKMPIEPRNIERMIVKVWGCSIM